MTWQSLYAEKLITMGIALITKVGAKILFSLRFRVLFVSILVLGIFFSLASVALQQGFKTGAEQALQEKLLIQIYGLLSAAELDHSARLLMPESLPETRYATPGSGLFAVVREGNGQLHWKSPSAVGNTIKLRLVPDTGKFKFIQEDNKWYQLHYTVIWEDRQGEEHQFVFSVYEDANAIANQVNVFSKQLHLWLLLIACASLLAEILVLSWSLKPLRNIGRDLKAMESGDQQRLKHDYGTELQELADNINDFLDRDRQQLQRYRNSLADLAHSLKTPLAILSGCCETPDFPVGKKQLMNEQLQVLQEIVEYQLQKASAKGVHNYQQAIDLNLIVGRLMSSLDKVYHDKTIHFQRSMPKECKVRYESGDLYEIIGNLLDNACKWCRETVCIEIYFASEQLYIEISDDGVGIAEENIAQLLLRGVRADERVLGHGIGLAVVNDLVKLLGGMLIGGKHEKYGGLHWTVILPLQRA